MIHMQILPPKAPNINNLRRPRRSMRTVIQTIVRHVLVTPNIPVVKKEADVPVTPMLLNTVGE